MKITTNQVTKMVISDVKSLDPVAVIVENFGPGEGKITITCFGEAWSAYWGSMGERHTLESFFCKCDEHYLAGKLKTGIKDAVTTDEGLEAHLRKAVITQRLEGDLTKRQARDLWEMASRTEIGDADNLYSILGDEWWLQLPEEPNPEYRYLCRIILAVQDAFKQQALEKQNG